MGLTIWIAAFALAGTLTSALGQDSRTPGSDFSEGRQPQREQFIESESNSPVEPAPHRDDPLSEVSRSQVILWASTIVCIAAMACFFSRRFDWQRIDPGSTCAHCVRVHSSLGPIALLSDSVAVSASFTLLAFPFAAALNQEPFDVAKIGILILLALAALSVMAVLGFLLSAVIPSKGPKRAIEDRFLVGARWFGFLISLALLSGGFATEDVTERLGSVLGKQLGDRLVTDIGASALRNTAVVIFISVVASCLIRWVIPYVLRSRPILFSAPHVRRQALKFAKR